MNIKLYDIGRADCVLLKDQDKNLLIDCGVKREDITNSMDINNDLSYSDNHLLITHFHNDHIRGLDHIYGDVFDKVYMSRFIICLFQRDASEILEKFVKLYAYTPSKTKINIYLKNILLIYKKISKVIKQKGILEIVNKGDVISHIKEFIVLHPDLDCESFVDTDVMEAADQYISVMEKGMQKATVKKIKDLAKQFATLLNGLNIDSKQEKFLFHEQISKDALKQINKIVLELRSAKKEIEEYVDFNDVNKAFGKYMNNNSIVLHDSDILFTGDVHASVINSLQSQELFYESYKAIKIPNHGSNTHFSMNLPYADFLLSCSDSVIWDINLDSQYLNVLFKSVTIFSNGDVFHNGHIFHRFYDGQIKINL